jgi:hypothetical protein
MAWVLRLVETGIDRPSRVIDVLDIRPRGDLGDIADLGLTLSEAKQILARLQQALVAIQADDHAVQRPVCSSCRHTCHVKDWRLHRVATLFGMVAIRLPRFRCASCGHGETGVSWLSYCRSTPELDQLRAHMSALMSYRPAAGLLAFIFCRLIQERAQRRYEAIPSRLGSSFAMPLRGSLVLPYRRLLSPSIRHSSAAVTMASGIWRFGSATSRPPAAADKYSAPWRSRRRRSP